MRLTILLTGLFASVFSIQAQDRPFLAIRSDMIIDADVIIQRAEYTVNPDSWSPIIIEGENIDVNFNDAVLYGNADPNHPEFYSGIAIIVRNAKNVKIRNLRAYRFMKILHIENSQDITIDNCDFSYLYRPPIYSNEHKVSELDKISFSESHLIALGAAVYAKNVHRCEVNNSKISNSMTGFVLENCDSWRIFNNNIMFNSAAGIVMRQGSRIQVRHNRIDFNSRSSYKSYMLRKNDNPIDMGSSAIITIGNVKDLLIAHNSMTHSEVGLKMLVDTNSGLPERCTISSNLIAHNLSYGIKIGGIGHVISNNRIADSPNGVGLYDCNATLVSDNEISTTDSGINSTLSTNITVANNLFEGQNKGINIAQVKELRKMTSAEKPSFTIEKNHFISNTTAIEALSNRGLSICENYFEESDYGMIFNSWKRNWIPKNNFFNPGIPENFPKYVLKNNKNTKEAVPFQAGKLYAEAELLNGQNAMIPVYPFTGRTWIMMDKYGPYDFRYPFIEKIQGDLGNDTLIRFGIYGPWQQSWSITNSGAMEFDKTEGIFQDTIVARHFDKNVDLDFQCRYIGSFFTNRNGQVIPFNDTFLFQYAQLNFSEDWNVAYHSISNVSELQDIDPQNLDKLQRTIPAHSTWKDKQKKQQNSRAFLELFEDTNSDQHLWKINADQHLDPGDHLFRLTFNGKILVKINQENSLAADSGGEIKTYLIPLKINSNEQKFEIYYLALYDQTVLHFSRHSLSDPVKN